MKLSTKTFLFTATLGTITIFGMGFVSYFQLKSVLEKNVQVRYVENIRQVMDRIDRFMYERLSNIEVISGEQIFSDYLANRDLAKENLNTTFSIQTRLREYSFLTGPWDVLSIVGMDGNVIFSTVSKEIGGSIKNDPLNFAAFEKSLQGEINYSDAHVSEETGKPTVIFSAPIRNKRNNQQLIQGVVMGQLAWPVITEFLDEQKDPVILYNKHDLEISTNFNEIGHHSDFLKNHNTNTDILRHIQEKKTMAMVIQDHHKEQKVLAVHIPESGYLTYRGNDWYIVSETPLDIANASAKKTALILSLIIVPFIFLLIGLYLIFILKKISKPIKELTISSKAIAAGNFNKRVVVERKDEIGELGNSFNEMGRKLKDYKEKMKTMLLQERTQVRKLKELDRMKDDFLNIAAHELKTPLTSIIGLSELIQRNKEEHKPHKNQRYIEIIHEESSRLKRVVNQILTVTRFESGKKMIQIERFDLVEFLESLYSPLATLAKRKQAHILMDIQEKSLFITSDEEKISEVIYNLVENAVKYGSEKQTITIALRKLGEDKVKISVTDQGEGISEESQKKLFHKFSQLEKPMARSGEGTGLGLHISKLIVERLGGTIGVKSTIGKGSTFYFTLLIKAKQSSKSAKGIRPVTLESERGPTSGGKKEKKPTSV